MLEVEFNIRGRIRKTWLIYFMHSFIYSFIHSFFIQCTWRAILVLCRERGIRDEEVVGPDTQLRFSGESQGQMPLSSEVRQTQRLKCWASSKAKQDGGTEAICAGQPLRGSPASRSFCLLVTRPLICWLSHIGLLRWKQLILPWLIEWTVEMAKIFFSFAQAFWGWIRWPQTKVGGNLLGLHEMYLSLLQAGIQKEKVYVCCVFLPVTRQVFTFMWTHRKKTVSFYSGGCNW
jgi:hypothetical protein